MPAAERAACKAMGRECCKPQSSGVSHVPILSAPLAAFASTELSLSVPAAREISEDAEPAGLLLYPALLHGIGLFTFFSVFLI